MKIFPSLALMLSVSISGCATCNPGPPATGFFSRLASGCSYCDKAEFLAVLEQEEKISANWAPGEFDFVDTKRAYFKQIREETLKSGDYTAGCEAIQAFIHRHRVHGV